MQRITSFAPAGFASLLFLAGFAAVAYVAYRGDDNHLVYALDDPYIHMAMAKNFDAHGIWGVTRYGFSSSTSSPLWTLLLALGFRISGVWDPLPGLLAAAFGVVSLGLVDALCRQFSVQGFWRRLAAGLAVVLFTPLIPLCATGMEHSLHLATALALLHATALTLDRTTPLRLSYLAGASLLACATRYESMFLVAPFAVLLAARGRRWTSGLAAAAGALPIVAYGLVSRAEGGFFLPNSLVIKGRFPDSGSLKRIVLALGFSSWEVIADASHLYALCILLLATTLFFWPRERMLSRLTAALLVSIGLHCQFARIGWFYRYEAYLVGLGTALLGVAWLPLVRLPRLWGHLAARIALIAIGELLLLAPLNRRAVEALIAIPQASRNIYEQPYQMAHLVAEELGPDAWIALNDLGALTYYTDSHVLDLVGLGSVEVARLKRENRFDTAAIAGLLAAEQIEYVAVCDDWFVKKQTLPRTLFPVGAWTIDNNIICAGPKISFYATNESNAARLAAALHRYAPRLPSGVVVTYERAAVGVGRAAE
jgi:hypothetical protein